MTRPSYRILIAEDNAVNLKLITRILTKLNHIPEIAINGNEVLQKLQQQHFDLILMDVQMPGMDGLETTREIISKFEVSMRPIIIAMTANAMKGDKETCLEAGMDDYISKPIIIKELEEKINDWGKKKLGELELTEYHPSCLHQLDVPNHIISLERLDLLRTLQPHHPALLDLFGFFFSQCQELLKMLHHELVEGNMDGMRKNAHSLKGACLNYGALQIAELCGLLEQQLGHKELQELLQILNQIETSLDLTTRIMTEWLHAQA